MVRLASLRACCTLRGMKANVSDSEPARSRVFLTLAEAAAELDCTRRFLETRISAGELRVFKPSRRLVRIRRTDFDSWVEGFCSKEPQP